MQPLPISDFDARLPGQISLLRDLVQLESPTTHKSALDQLGQFIAQQMQALGGRILRHEQAKAGDHWSAQWGADEGGILLLTHMDTVHPLGSLERMPWREEGTKLYGPGVLDMKSGIAIALTAIQAWLEHQSPPRTRVSLLVSSDEETGSHSSRALIESMARDHALVLCLEPGLPDDSIKTWRKGVGMFTLKAHGRAAHAGAQPGSGINAIVEMAHQIPDLIALAHADRGTTLNVGFIQGGTRSNVVPEQCKLRLDVRVMHAAEAARIEQALESIKPRLKGAELSLSGSFNRPPMPPTAQRKAAFERARRISERIGLTLTEGGTGGASDANFVAALNIPVLDGLGALGNGAHSSREHVLRASLPRRTALLTALLTHWHRMR